MPQVQFLQMFFLIRVIAGCVQARIVGRSNFTRVNNALNTMEAPCYPSMN